MPTIDSAQQVFDLYHKTLPTLENELQNLINQKEKATKETPVNKKQIKKLTEKISTTRRDIFQKKHQYKLAAAKQEETNREYLIAVQSDKDWYKFTHYSACYFSIDIMPRLKNANRFHLYPDTDNYGYSVYGIISVKIDATFIAELQSLNIKEENSNIEGLRFFKLPWKYSDKRFSIIISEVEKNQSKLNSILIPKIMNPHLYKQIADLNEATYHAVKAISEPFVKDTIGKALFSHSTNLIINYLKTASGKIDAAKINTAIQDELNIFSYLLKTLLDLGVIKYRDGLRIGGLVVQVRNAIKGVLNAKN